MQIKISFPLPPTLNEQIRVARGRSWRNSANLKDKWTELATEISQDYIKQLPQDVVLPLFSKAVWQSFEWDVLTFASDPDNISAAAKFINDGLVHGGILAKDNLKLIHSPVTHWYKKAGKTCDRVTEDITTSKLLAKATKTKKKRTPPVREKKPQEKVEIFICDSFKESFEQYQSQVKVYFPDFIT